MATQIVVTVDSDLTVPTEIDRVTVDVGDNASAPEASADLTAQALPRSIGLVHNAGTFDPFVVTARGYLGSTLVIEKAVKTAFEKGKTREVTLQLDRACKDVFCTDGQTCVLGGCDDIPRVDSGGSGGSGGGNGGGFVPGGDGGQAGGADAAAATGGDGGAVTGGVDAGSDAGAMSRADAGPGAGATPVCTIDLPQLDDAYQTTRDFQVSGSCTDAESGVLTLGLSWTSDLDGPLGAGAARSVSLRTEGTHLLTLCAPDPEDGSVQGCADVVVKATQRAQPQVSITSIRQGNSASQPFRTTQAVAFTGTGSGAGITLAWNDSVHGGLGTGSSVSLAQPEVGKHKVTLIGTDRDAVSVEASDSYTVLAPGQSTLVESFTAANAALGGNGGNGGSASVATLGSDGTSRLYAAANGKLYVLAGDQGNPSGSVAVNAPPLEGSVQDVFVDAAAELAYLGTSGGLTVCPYAAATGIGSMCSTHKDGDLPDNSVRSVLRMTDEDGTPRLLVGTSDGLLTADSVAGSSSGNVALEGRRINALAAAGPIVWIATDQGLYRYNPATDSSQRWSTDQGAPSNTITSVAIGSDGAVWVGSSNGLGRFVYASQSGQWTLFRTADGLVSNSVNAVAVAATWVAGVERDVIWVATNAGVSRFDPSIPAFVSFTTSDGLPSNTVRDVVVLSDGSKVFATAAGVARYTGP